MSASGSVIKADGCIRLYYAPALNEGGGVGRHLPLNKGGGFGAVPPLVEGGGFGQLSLKSKTPPLSEGGGFNV